MENLDEQFISIKEVEEMIDNLENPYPKDIFEWNDKGEKLGFNRGRFNQFWFEIVESFREDLKKSLRIMEEK